MMAAGFAESYIRLWSLKSEKLRGMRSDFQPSSIKDGPRHFVQPSDVLLIIYLSCGAAKAQGKGRDHDQKVDRAQRTDLFTLFRPIERFCYLAKIFALLLRGWNCAVMVTRHNDKHSRLSGPSKPSLGCKMESDGGIFCHR
jgi:hypothetical protein